MKKQELRHVECKEGALLCGHESHKCADICPDGGIFWNLKIATFAACGCYEVNFHRKKRATPTK